MNIRIESRDIRLRLSASEWQELQTKRRISLSLHLGLLGTPNVDLLLTELNGCEIQGHDIRVQMNQADVLPPLRKKDPYWVHIDEQGIRWSLDVDIIPEEKR